MSPLQIGNPLLGVSVTAGLAPPTGGIPTATDTWFVAAVSDKPTAGTTAAQKVRNLAEFEGKFGTRTAGNIALWDAVDVFFREGGKQMYIATAKATVTGTPPNEVSADPDVDALLDQFTQGLGPGQVSAIGFDLDTGAAPHLASLWGHALLNNRFVLADVPATAVDGSTDLDDLSDYADLIDDDTDGMGALFAPWVTVPAPAGVSGVSPRHVPASPVIAALCARVDAGGNPNVAAAGRSYPLQYVTDIDLDPGMADRVTMLDAGVNLFAEVYGVLENYGFQTPVDQNEDNPFWQANCGRTRMAIVAQSMAIGEQYMFKPIDGQGKTTGAFRSHIDGMLLAMYGVGALYGETPQDAYRVEAGATVNTVESIAQGILRASASVVLTLHAKAVQIELVAVPIGGTV